MSEYIDPHSRGGLPPTIPPPPWLEDENHTCYTPALLDDYRFLTRDTVSFVDAAKSMVILITAILSVVLNLMFVVCVNTKYYSKFTRAQPRHLLTAAALNDVTIAILVLTVGVYPALFECWPMGQALCQVQVTLGCFMIFSFPKVTAFLTSSWV